MTALPNTRSSCRPRRDAGSILPMVLVMTVVLSAMVVSLATYVTSGLRYSTVVEDRADRLAAADGGLRYGIERLQLQAYAGCFTSLGNTGYKIPFPAVVNGSTVEVTCRKAGTGFGGVQGWAVLMTGEGVPADQALLLSQGGAGKQKLLGGPVYIARTTAAAFDLQAPVEIEDGDLWYSDTTAKCDNAENDPPGKPANLSFKPILRGMLCLDKPWNVLYTAPTVSIPTTAAVPPDVDVYGCTVFSPGKYTSHPALGAANYFKSGEYYFEDVPLVIDRTVVAGWGDFSNLGDQQFVTNPKCDEAVYADRTAPLSKPGATWYLGGTSTIRVDQGKLEILRRRQGTSVVSLQALDLNGSGYKKSGIGWNTDIVSTKSGSPSQDMILHGLAWAPRAQLTFGNVTNVADGQLLGGAAFARIDLQSSASASNFVIRVESGPIPVTVVLDAKATKGAGSTTMRAVVQINDIGTETAINSWRVVD
jgi:hypothetical protein